jgi:negative regulator of sigma E activity
MKHDPMDFEDQLRAALRRQDPSPGFANRVIAQTRPAPVKVMPRRKPMWVWGTAIAAMLALAIGVNDFYRQKQAEQASEQAVLALQIAAEKLNAVQAKVLRSADRGVQGE